MKCFNVLSKVTLIYCLILLMFLFCLPVRGDFDACVYEYGSITETLNAIPENAGNVTIRLWRSVFTEEDSLLEIPADRGITKITFEPDEGIDRIALSDLYRICANGVPLTIAEGLIFENGNIYGGACVSEGEIHLDHSLLNIEGDAAFVFGGGFAENGAVSTVRETSVVVGRSGTVYYEVFGGGHAYGENSRVSVETTSVQIDGTAAYVLGGGFGEEGGTSECETTFTKITESALAEVALFSGGSASGTGSCSIVGNAKAVIDGRAASAFSGDFASGGGMTELNQASRLEISSSGSSDYVYMGSFATDPGSDARVNTSEVMSCGITKEIYRKSQSSNNAEAKTLITALFPCQ